MNMDLKSYIKLFPDVIPHNVCEQSLFELKNVNWKQHIFRDGLGNSMGPVSGDNELDSFYDDISTLPDFEKIVYNCIGNYISELNFPWYCGWNGYTKPKFNRYLESRTMALHCDHIHSMFPGTPKGVPVLSVIGALNDEYEGGEFIIFDDMQLHMPKGSITIFPSNFLYPHKVLPVTKGVRNTFVCWVF